MGITGRCSLVPLDVTSLVSISSGPGHPYLRNRNAYAESSSKQASPRPDFSNIPHFRQLGYFFWWSTKRKNGRNPHCVLHSLPPCPNGQS